MADYRSQFIEAMRPHAMRVSQKTGLDPRIIIAQAAQETGWGRSAPNNNYFGIKSHGKAGGSTLATREVINGQEVTVNDSFRSYGSMGESVDGYASFLQENPRYSEMLGAKGLDAQVRALGKSGYATDPNYASSVFNIAQSIPMEDPITMSTISGQAPAEDIAGYRWNPQTGTLERSNQPNASVPLDQMQGFGPTEALSSDPSVSTQGTQPNGQPSPTIGQKGWLTPKRSDMLLAIGSGLLSGEDWATGIAGASNNLLALNQGTRAEDLQQQRIDQMGQDAAAPTRKIPLGQVELPDGSVRVDLLQDPITGTVYDSNGKVVDVTGAERRNNSDVYGSRGVMTAKQAQEEQSWLTNTSSSLTAFDRTIHTVENMKFGLEGFAQTMSAYAQTMAGRGLSPEQIAKMVAAGDLQGLIGQSREQVVGPGVMTEQDAARVVAYLGGDINAILMNPDAAFERLQIARSNMLKEYDQRYRQYGAHLDKYDELPYQPITPYSPWTPKEFEGVLDESNAGSSATDNGGKFDPDEIDKILKLEGI